MRVCPECRTRTEARTCPTCRITTVDEAALSGEDLVGRVFMERYEVLGLLGQGGMGAVYRARHLAMDAIVALKVLRRDAGQNLEAIERFYREARAASRLKHPNTIRVFDFGQSEDGQMFLAMEYLEGVSLRTEMQRVGMFPEERLLRIAEQVASSLGEAHQKGIVHRDVKPENVFLLQMLGAPDFVKVLDFGIARNLAGDTMTRTGMAIGTPAYMSPEQARGEKVDGRSDLYSLGVMLFELAAGVPPFTSGTPMQLLLKHLHDPPPRLSELRVEGLSREFEELVMDLLGKDPETRPRDAEQVLRRIATIRGSGFGVVGSGEVAPTPRRGTDVAFLEQLASADSPTTPIGAMQAPPSGPGPAFHEAGTLLGTRTLSPDLTVAPVRKDGGPSWNEGPRSRGQRPSSTPVGDLPVPGTPRRRVWWLLVPLALAGAGAWWWLGDAGSASVGGPGDEVLAGAPVPREAADLPGDAGRDVGVPATPAPADARSAPEDPGGPSQPAREPVTVRIVGTPAGAVVRRQGDGAVLGVLPLDLVVSPGQHHRLRVEARGFRPLDLEIDWEGARQQSEQSVRLERRPPGRESPTDDWEL
ncbi:MAG TPA: protein kinase [Myxococcota bacterium]|nr:protein kinase [Myxococcota bacterium]HQK51955.1 protein kinase [Myxococcota bacterium]